MIIFRICILFATTSYVWSAVHTKEDTGNYLRIAVSGKEESDPVHSKRHGFLSEGEYHSVYDKGPVFPGGGVKKQHFFISPKGKIFPTFHLSAALEDYTVFDGLRERVIPFFDPEKWMTCDCDVPFPAELDIPHRFAVYHPVTVQAPLPDVPQDLYTIKYTGHYYACPVHVNPYEFGWYKGTQAMNPCRWIWYQSIEDSASNIRH